MRSKVRLVLFSIGLLAASCTSQDSPQRGTVFRYNESKGITSLDPAFARSMGNIWAVNQLFNGLVQLDDSLRVQPCLAQRWEISADGQRYTFHMRQDVRFHDHTVFAAGKGRAVTARDVLFSFNRVLDPATLSPGRWVFAAVADGGFAAPDDSTLIITLKEPYPPFLGILSMPYCAVVPKEAVDKFGHDFGRHPIGTGPFRFEAWYEGVKLVLHKNPHYFERDDDGTPLPHLDAVGISFITDPQSIFLEFMKGNLDMLSGLEDGSYKDALLTPNGTLHPELTDRMRMIAMPFLNTEYLGFLLDDTAACMQGSPLLDVRVRQAINMGFDRRAMLRHLRSNIGTPGEHGFIPPASQGFAQSPTQGYSYDPKRAAQLLAEAGFPNGKGMPEITLHTTSQYADLCEYMQDQLGRLGIKLKVDVHPGPTLAALVANGQVPFFRKSWMADHADAENYLSLFLSRNATPNGPNYTRFGSAAYDALYARAMGTVNDSLRTALYRSMDSIVTAQAPTVVLYYDRVLRFVNPEVQGLGANAMNVLSLKKVRKSRGRP
jgi:oligopeptide transport system substrate-binding protein